MEVVPCSRVGHLIRRHLPYRFPDQDLLQRNKIRIAETWMDTYKKIYYRRDTLAHFIRQVFVCMCVCVCESTHLVKRLSGECAPHTKNETFFLCPV